MVFNVSIKDHFQAFSFIYWCSYLVVFIISFHCLISFLILACLQIDNENPFKYKLFVSVFLKVTTAEFGAKKIIVFTVNYADSHLLINSLNLFTVSDAILVGGQTQLKL